MNAIGLCIQAVDDRITKLQTLRASLVECGSLMADAPAITAVAPKPAPAVSVKRLDSRVKKPGVRGPYKKRTSPPIRVGTMDTKAAKPNGALGQTRPTNAGNPTTQALLEGKADTVVGAMKRLLVDEAMPFTREELIENLQGDADYKKLLEREGGMKALENALYNWSNAGKLKKDGDNYTVTAAGKEWMGR